jgi:predicted AAA+ superfamily ATPase
MTTQNGFEIDFYLPETRTLIQVTQNMSNSATREREIRAMQDAVKTVDAQNLLILSDDNEDSIRIGEKEIQIHSIPEWLLQQPG